MDFHTALGKMSSYSERHTSLRRPHEANSSSITAQTLVLKIKSIQCDTLDEDTIAACLTIFENLIKSDDIAVILGHLYTACLGDSYLIRPTALFLSKAIKRTAGDGNMLRSKWLGMLQNKYESKNDLYQQSFETFLNVLSIHGETFNVFIIATEKIQVLAPPLIEYLDLAVTKGTEAAFKVLIMQLVINGNSLRTQSIKQYEELQAHIRKAVLLKPSPYLLLAMDLTENFFLLDSKIQNFYKTELKDAYTVFESRAKSSAICPENVDLKKLSVNLSNKTSTDEQDTVLTISLNSTSASAVGGIPNVSEVRERMRAKGILPRKSSTPKKNNVASPGGNDDDFYGLQLPKSKTLDNKASDLSRAKTVALPKDEWD